MQRVKEEINDKIIELLNEVRFHIIQNNTLFALFSLRKVIDDSKNYWFNENLIIFVNDNSHKKIDFLDNKKFSKSFNNFLIANDLYTYIDLIDVSMLNKQKNIKGENIKLTENVFKNIVDNRIYSHGPSIFESNWASDYVEAGFQVSLHRKDNNYLLNDSSIDLFYTWLMEDYDVNAKKLGINKKVFEKNDRHYSIYRFNLHKKEERIRFDNIKEKAKVTIFEIEKVSDYYKSINESRMHIDLIDYFILANKCLEDKRIDNSDISNIYKMKEIIASEKNSQIREVLSWSVAKILNFQENEVYSTLKSIILNGNEMENISKKNKSFFNILKLLIWMQSKKEATKPYIGKSEVFISKTNLKSMCLFIIENENWKNEMEEFVLSLVKSDIINETFNRYSSINIDKDFFASSWFDSKTKINRKRLYDYRINEAILEYPIYYQSRGMRMDEVALLNILVINRKISKNEISKIKEGKMKICLLYERMGENMIKPIHYCLKLVEENNNIYSNKNEIFINGDVEAVYDDSEIIKSFNEKDFKIENEFLKEAKAELEFSEKYNHYQSIPALIREFINELVRREYDDKLEKIDIRGTWNSILDDSDNLFKSLYEVIVFPSESYNFKELMLDNYDAFKKIIPIKEFDYSNWYKY